MVGEGVGKGDGDDVLMIDGGVAELVFVGCVSSMAISVGGDPQAEMRRKISDSIVFRFISLPLGINS